MSYDKQYYEKNKERIKEVQRKSRLKCAAKRRAYNIKWEKKNHAKMVAYRSAWRKRNLDKQRAAYHRAKSKNPAKIYARQLVMSYIRRGKLKRGRCEKCRKLGHAHHDDYTKPLKVRWLCRQHHDKWHKQRKKKPNLLTNL